MSSTYVCHVESVEGERYRVVEVDGRKRAISIDGDHELGVYLMLDPATLSDEPKAVALNWLIGTKSDPGLSHPNAIRLAWVEPEGD